MKEHAEKINLSLGIICSLLTLFSIIKDELNIYFLIAGVAFILVFVLISFLKKRASAEPSDSKHRDIKYSNLKLEVVSLLLDNKHKASNKGLKLIKYEKTANVLGNDLEMLYKMDGICLDSKCQNGIELIFTSDRYIPFESLDCYGKDLTTGSNIKPYLKDADGIVKIAFFPFGRQIKKNDKFSYEICFKWENCMYRGMDYVANIVPFINNSKSKFIDYKFNLVFNEDAGINWCRSYAVKDELVLLNEMVGEKENTKTRFTESDNKFNINESRVYIFDRDK